MPRYDLGTLGTACHFRSAGGAPPAFLKGFLASRYVALSRETCAYPGRGLIGTSDGKHVYTPLPWELPIWNARGWDGPHAPHPSVHGKNKVAPCTGGVSCTWAETAWLSPPTCTPSSYLVKKQVAPWHGRSICTWAETAWLSPPTCTPPHA